MGNKAVKAIAIIFVALFAMAALVVLGNFLNGLRANSERALVGPTWQWTQFADPSAGSTTIADPSLYTITFNKDHTFDAKADCNNAGGSFSTDGSVINITVQTTTRAMCSPDSLSDRYLAYLNGARTFGLDGSTLRLDLFADSGTMTFAK